QNVVRQLAPQPHPRPVHGVPWGERRAGKDIVEVRTDYARFDDHVSIVHEYRHDPARIELLEFGRQLLAARKAQLAAGPRQLLFRQGDADLLGAHRDIVVIELEHQCLLGWAATLSRSLASKQCNAASLRETQHGASRVVGSRLRTDPRLLQNPPYP